MNKNKAIQLLNEVASMYKGTREDHKSLSEALVYLSKLEEPKTGEKKEKKESNK